MDRHLIHPDKKRRREGVWVFYNQALDQDWPTWHDGPFRAAWAGAECCSGNCYVDVWSCYGKVYSSGGATAGRASGVPVAIVATPPPNCFTTMPNAPIDTVGYRFHVRGRDHAGAPTYSWTPCPRAAYCWAAGALTAGLTQLGTTGRDLTLLDLTSRGGEFIVRALLSLKQHIDQEFAAHDTWGTFAQRAAAEGRTVRHLRKAWSRRTEVTRQVAEALEGAQGLAHVTVPPPTFLKYDGVRSTPQRAGIDRRPSSCTHVATNGSTSTTSPKKERRRPPLSPASGAWSSKSALRTITGCALLPTTTPSGRSWWWPTV